jgi:hypothetical protein
MVGYLELTGGEPLVCLSVRTRHASLHAFTRPSRGLSTSAALSAPPLPACRLGLPLL